MKKFGFLSFGHYGTGGGLGNPDARQSLHEAIGIAQAADDLGVNGAYFRVHHWQKQSASPMPLLAAIAATTKCIEVGTGVIDMRYENPLYMAEEAAQLDLIADNRVALGVSRGSPEPALRGYEAFGYTGSEDVRGTDIARAHFGLFMDAIRGRGVGPADPAQFGRTGLLRVEPQSPGLDRRIWWGAGSFQTAKWAAQQGVNLMSSTLVEEATGQSLGDLQNDQIEVYKEAWAQAGHDWTPRISVSRSVFPIVTEEDRLMYSAMGGDSEDQIGIIDGLQTTFGKSYVGEPDQLVEQLRQDKAVMNSDTLMLTIPSQLGVDFNARLLESFAKHIAPELGWEPANS
ncbi:LLM class flavin-dependent oxidoreductase [Brevibacterium sp. 91QC2O2]|uniref:LLM class flavin-dependent oxidoreductase n=1 Tax=Brevibacterium sp. 91QC2O2 TaxID=2968458 RepID=UPI00211C812B|nr:LLM class flavin-dependent oxidoreductase [Brevibacterium sp. 91QC2O2]MCQ9369545.1 LLM class flavin-dependent oxidoreductase [Brevibacterium sp. 91QC2O2]